MTSPDKHKSSTPARTKPNFGATTEFIQRVQFALEKAAAAADIAKKDFLRLAPTRPDGAVVDLHGFAHVMVRNPSTRLRLALKSLQKIDKWSHGRWVVDCFGHTGQQSVGLQERAAAAARDELSGLLAGEGVFYMESCLD